MSVLTVVAAVVMAVSASATEGNPLASEFAEEFPWNISVVPKQISWEGGDHGGSLLVLDPRHLPLVVLRNTL